MKWIICALACLGILGCANPNMHLQCGLFRRVPPEVPGPMMERLSAIPNIPLTPEQIEAIIKTLMPDDNRIDLLYFEMKARSQEQK